MFVFCVKVQCVRVCVGCVCVNVQCVRVCVQGAELFLPDNCRGKMGGKGNSRNPGDMSWCPALEKCIIMALRGQDPSYTYNTCTLRKLPTEGGKLQLTNLKEIP